MTDTLAETILSFLDKAERIINSLQLASQLKEDHQKVVGAINSLLTLDDVISASLVSSKVLELTPEGETFVERGSHEAVVYNAVPEEGIEQPILMKKFDDPTVGKVGFSKAIVSGWIVLDKRSGKPIVKRKVESIEDTVADLLKQLKSLQINDFPEKTKADLKKRQLIIESTIKSYNISKGSKFTTKVEKLEAELTPDMIIKGTWKEKKFKDYNFNALGVEPERGHLHPLLKVRQEFRQIFLEMGFSEMPTNNYVESSFWNFDSLFQPQQHPARDAHDTFFMAEPAVTPVSNLPADYVGRVKKVHSEGGYGSTGYHYDWKIEEAQKNILRTHTTAVSARMLYQVAQRYRKAVEEAGGDCKSVPFQPVKLFSIDRVFRNETLDATHLAEFHQIEGVVADVNLSLADLMGVIREFFFKMGLMKIKFKPAYNPYTEPSMEIFSFHEGLKKWVEIGNSGVFRPEMLLPMGLPPEVSVIAWGLSTERPTMIKYGINNIRDLVGHKVDLQLVYDNPLCILTSQ